MNWWTLLRRTLRCHRRGNLAVILGIAVGTAVLVGALLVGDSLRGSLRDRVVRRLGKVQSLARPFQPVTNETSIKLAAQLDTAAVAQSLGTVAILDREDHPVRRARDVSLVRVESELFESLSGAISSFQRTDDRLPQITRELAAELELSGRATVSVRRVNNHRTHPESIFGHKSGPELFIEEKWTVDRLLPGDGRNTFNPFSTGGPNRTIFSSIPATRYGEGELTTLLSKRADVSISELRGVLKLADYGLHVRHGQNARKIQLQSDGLFLSPAVTHSALAAARDLNFNVEPTLVYLANSISDGTHEIPYSVVAALNPQAAAPLGPFLDPKEPPLADDEILLADWGESQLTAKPGGTITLKYFLPESEGKATEATATFKLRAKVPMTGVAADPSLTPEFPGITDKLTLGEWDPPFPYDPKRIQRRDEEYWKKYRATPKAYVNSAVGQKLFGSRFGVATSVRIAPKSPETIDADAKAFEAALMQHLNPADFGFVFRDVREEALKTAEGSVNFSGLFLGFSIFLIAAALLLVALLVRLNLDRRASEIGIWLALGFTTRQVRRLLLAEGLWLAVLGAVFGLVMAVGYTALMLRLIGAMWPEGEIGAFLGLHATPMSLAIGFLAAVVFSSITIAFALRSLRRVPTIALLRGVSSYQPEAQVRKPKVLSRLRFGLAFAVAFLSLVAGFFLREPEPRAGAFFTAGAAFLTIGLMLLRRRLAAGEAASSPDVSVMQLGIRNAARNPTRSMLTAGLIASATFLLVAVESFRRSPAVDFAEKGGGSGGFQLIASLDMPLYQDPDDPASGRQEILDALERVGKLAGAEDLLKASKLIPIRAKAGDDASCRNLNRPIAPRLLGVPNRFIHRGGFHFASVIEAKSKPWELLLAPGDAIPAFGEANTVKWILGKSLGDTITVTDGRGQPAQLRIVGLMQDSIFQGELVLDEKRLLELYPTLEGYSMLLVEAPPGREGEMRTLLETAYADRGISVERSMDRLQSYLAVENTYLSTFQILGGFGLLLGACGLGVALMRSAWERRGELALLQAVGFRRSQLGWLVFSETLCLLLFGLGIGIVAALLAVLPQRLAGESATIPIAQIAVMLGGVLLVGLAAGLWALRLTLQAPLVPALQDE